MIADLSATRKALEDEDEHRTRRVVVSKPSHSSAFKVSPTRFGARGSRSVFPTGKMSRDERLEALLKEDGITSCGNAQNCVQACPMNIPLTRAIYEENREAIVHGLFGWLRK